MNRRKPAPVHRPGRRLGALALLLWLPSCQSDLQSAFSAGASSGTTSTGGDAPEDDSTDDAKGSDDDALRPADDDTEPSDDDTEPSDDDASEPAPSQDDDDASGDDPSVLEPGDDDSSAPDPVDDDPSLPEPGDDDALDPADDGSSGIEPGDGGVPVPNDDEAPEASDDDLPGTEGPGSDDPPQADAGASPPPADDAAPLPEPGADDLCPDDPEKTEPGACGCDVPDSDSDGDGALDCEEACPQDAEKTEPLLCGCGVPDADGDEDGTPDCSDGCPEDGEKTEPGACGCGMSDDSGADSIAQCLDLSGSLVHRYRFEGNGTTAADDVGDADGTLVGTTLTGTGSVNLSTGPYVDLPNDVLDGLVNATFEVWVRRGSLTDAFQRILDFGDSGIEGESNLGQTYIYLTPRTTPEKGDAIRLTYYNGVNEVALTGAASLPLRAASHVAAVFDDDGDRMLLYVNGSVVAQGTWTDQLADINTINSWLGRSQFIADPGFDGSIDEFRIYDAALDAEQLEYSIAAGTDPPFLD